MFFVDRPVHADGGLQVVQPPVGADAIGDGRQGGRAETGGAGGYGVAAHPHDAGVHLLPLQIQLGQDVLSIFQAVLLPERNTEVKFPRLPSNRRNGAPRDSLLNRRDELGLETARRQQRLRGLSAEQQLVLRQLHQQQPDDLSQIHAADHLLEATGGRRQRRNVTFRGQQGGRWV